jgi:site-specific recombinase XerC
MGKDLIEANRADFKSYIGFLRQEKGLKVKSITLRYTALASLYDYLIERRCLGLYCQVFLERAKCHE